VKNRGLEALEAAPKCENYEYTRSPIYKQNKTCCQVRGAFDRNPACVRSSDVRSTAVALQCHVYSSVGVAFDRSAFERT
jgi:hypothetical protein